MRIAGGFAPARDVQTLVDAEHAPIVTHAVTLDAADNRQLEPMAEAAKKAWPTPATPTASKPASWRQQDWPAYACEPRRQDAGPQTASPRKPHHALSGLGRRLRRLFAAAMLHHIGAAHAGLTYGRRRARPHPAPAEAPLPGPMPQTIFGSSAASVTTRLARLLPHPRPELLPQ